MSKMTTQGINSILSSYCPIDLIAKEYYGYLLCRNIITDTDGRRYVSNRDVSVFILSSFKDILDKEQSEKRLKALQKTENINPNYIDTKGRI